MAMEFVLEACVDSLPSARAAKEGGRHPAGTVRQFDHRGDHAFPVPGAPGEGGNRVAGPRLAAPPGSGTSSTPRRSLSCC